MRISATGLPEIPATAPVSETARVDDGPSTASGQASPAAAELQSAVLQPALAALQAMPNIDQAKVAALRDALARGEVPFNAARLAGLIERYHGSHE